MVSFYSITTCYCIDLDLHALSCSLCHFTWVEHEEKKKIKVPSLVCFYNLKTRRWLVIICTLQQKAFKPYNIKILLAYRWLLLAVEWNSKVLLAVISVFHHTMPSRSLPAKGNNSLMKGAAMPDFFLRRVSRRFWSTGTSILTHQLLLIVVCEKKKSKEADALISVFKVWKRGKNKGKNCFLRWGIIYCFVI